MKNTILIVLGLTALFTSCASVVKSKNQILDFKIDFAQLYDTDTMLCRITGNSQDSALWIRSYRIEYRGKDVYLIIEKSLEPSGISNPYFIQFVVPKGAERIYLGHSELLWQSTN